MTDDSMLLPVTQWFEGDPYCPGVWECLPALVRSFRYWDGKKWSVGAPSPQQAYEWRVFLAFSNPTAFRGTVKPEYFPTYEEKP